MSAYHDECPQCGASPGLLADYKRLRELLKRCSIMFDGQMEGIFAMGVAVKPKFLELTKDVSSALKEK